MYNYFFSGMAPERGSVPTALTYYLPQSVHERQIQNQVIVTNKNIFFKQTDDIDDDDFEDSDYDNIDDNLY